MKAYLQKQNINLLWLTNRLDEESTAQNRRWLEANVKTNIALMITISDAPLAEVSYIIEGYE